MGAEQLAVALIGGGSVGAIATALINKLRTREDKEAVKAATAKARQEGEAVVLASMAEAFTEVTGGLRAEIERLQGDAGEIRARAVRLESELDAALARVEDLERQLTEAKAINDRLQGDLDRVRGERDALQDRCVQQEGEIRQLKSIIEAQKIAKG